MNKAFDKNPSNIWDVLEKLQFSPSDTYEPNGDEFYNFYSNLAKPSDNCEFSKEYETMAKNFISDCKGDGHMRLRFEIEIF